MGRAHSNGYNRVKDFFDLEYLPKLQVVAARDAEKAKAFADRWGYARVESDWRKVVAADDVDAIDICTPNNLHAEIAIEAAKHGKAILCEKPLSMDTAEGEKMCAAVEKAGVPNMVWYNYRRIPAVTFAKQIIDSGKLGRVFHYRAEFLQDWTINADLPQGGAALWRLDSAAVAARAGPVWFDDAHVGRVAADPGVLGDVVIARRDVPTSYHLAVVVDDAVQGVTLVTRGEDLLAATHVHRLLQAALGLPVPAYAHHGLLRDGSGARLSKRDGALSVRALREAGRSPAAVLALATDGVTGLPPEIGNGPAATARATSAPTDEAGG
jgi:hypothetical protein